MELVAPPEVPQEENFNADEFFNGEENQEIINFDYQFEFNLPILDDFALDDSFTILDPPPPPRERLTSEFNGVSLF